MKKQKFEITTEYIMGLMEYITEESVNKMEQELNILIAPIQKRLLSEGIDMKDPEVYSRIVASSDAHRDLPYAEREIIGEELLAALRGFQ